MVAKITSGASIMGVLAYNNKKVEKGDGEIIFTNEMIVPYGDMERLTVPVIMKSFQPYLDANLNTKKPVFHVSLNPHPDDKLTDTDYNLIAHEYMEKMGYDQQPYVVYKHTDLNRTHLHIVSLRTDINGRKLPHSYEAKKSMDILRHLEEKYRLTPALKGISSRMPFTPEPVRYKDGNILQNIGSYVKGILANYRFTNFSTLNLMLRTKNIHAEIVKGKYRGREYEGLLYHLLEENGRKTGTPIKASTIGRDAGLKAINRRIEESINYINQGDNVSRLRTAFDLALELSTSYGELAKKLLVNGIRSYVFEEKTTDQTIRFLDSQTSFIFNSRVLGERYSIRNIQATFERNRETAKQVQKSSVDVFDAPYYSSKKGQGWKL